MESRDKHYNVCINNDFCRVRLPEMTDFKDNRWITYEGLGKEVRVPFTIYADFECLLKPVKGKMKQCKDQSYTEEVNRHVPSDFCLYIKFAHGTHPRALQRYTGEDCVERFVDILKHETERILDWPQKAMNPLTDEEKEAYKQARTCYLCKGGFGLKKYMKVRDHCHFTGKYRGLLIVYAT